MITEKFKKVFPNGKAIIGMVHVGALPGTPLYDRKRGLEGLVDDALADAKKLVEAGVDGIQIENQWDRPFLKANEIGPEVVSVLTHITTLIGQLSSIPLGMNVHLNACNHAMAIAKATNCKWIRAFELANGYISNSGYVDAAGPQLMRYRSMIDADDIMVFGDFQVKHGSHAITSDRTVIEKAHDIEAFLGDAAIITGLSTGNPPDGKSCDGVHKELGIPLLIGSGLSSDNIQTLWPYVDGAVIGSSFKVNGVLSNPIDKERVERFIDKARKLEK